MATAAAAAAAVVVVVAADSELEVRVKKKGVQSDALQHQKEASVQEKERRKESAKGSKADHLPRNPCAVTPARV